jgi:hypothetical protein
MFSRWIVAYVSVISTEFCCGQLGILELGFGLSEFPRANIVCNGSESLEPIWVPNANAHIRLSLAEWKCFGIGIESTIQTVPLAYSFSHSGLISNSGQTILNPGSGSVPSSKLGLVLLGVDLNRSFGKANTPRCGWSGGFGYVMIARDRYGVSSGEFDDSGAYLSLIDISAEYVSDGVPLYCKASFNFVIHAWSKWELGSSVSLTYIPNVRMEASAIVNPDGLNRYVCRIHSHA